MYTKTEINKLLKKRDEWEILTPLTTMKIGEELWMTLIPHQFKTPMGIITVPAGFLFDHASVPRTFTNIVPPVKSCLAEASLLHDWFYVKDSVDIPRKIADMGLKMITVNTSKWTESEQKITGNLAKWAVSWFAGNFYNQQFFHEKYRNAYSIFRDRFDLRKLQEQFVISWEVNDRFVFNIKVKES